MEDFEKLGVFYLGKLYDMAQKTLKNELLLYDSRDLVTHAVCVGMTGSGKTGLCLDLIEEAAIDGVPAILIDPKGDLGNLLLTFPQLRGEDFLPWINVDDAKRKNLSPQDFADQQAATWKKGLADWGQSGERIQRLRDAAEFAIYTPGSSAGLPVSILNSFAVPPQAILEDGDLLRERISTTVNGLLGLVGVDADPIQSREHILLSTIMDLAWRKGQDLDLAALIQQVQKPPVSKIGVLDLESFYPAKERFGLVLALNNLLASPGFDAWLHGEAMNIGQMLYTPEGKPRIAIFYIAHLGDAERMFFVSLLLNQVLGWMRAQPGTTSLRALLYMDEIFGFLPPVANPPSKQPMLTLLKQARAFGLGIVLATQNPVDLDYKALSNTGTWFIGRLQTERDKARLLDGLEGASTSTGMAFNRQETERLLASLGNRVFLMNNVHDEASTTFQTRWAMSYLRGPLTREQIKMLTPQKRPATAAAPTPRSTSAPSETVSAGVSVHVPAGQPPSLPPDVPMYFIPTRRYGPSESKLVYQPTVFGAARVRFTDRKTGVDLSKDAAFVTPITDDPVPVSWDRGQSVDLIISDLEKSPQSGAQFGDLAPAAGQVKSYAVWSRDLADWVYRSQGLELLRSPSFGEVARPDELERDFRVRLQQAAREKRDAAVDALRRKYASKMTTLQDRVRRAEEKVQREASQAKQAKAQTAVSFGTTLIGALLGRKAISSTTVTRAGSAARAMSRSSRASQDVARAEDSLQDLQTQLKDLQAEFDAEVAALEARMDPLRENLETVVIRPKKTDIAVQLVSLVWAPYWQDAQRKLTPAW